MVLEVFKCYFLNSDGVSDVRAVNMASSGTAKYNVKLQVLQIRVAPLGGRQHVNPDFIGSSKLFFIQPKVVQRLSSRPILYFNVGFISEKQQTYKYCHAGNWHNAQGQQQYKIYLLGVVLVLADLCCLSFCSAIDCQGSIALYGNQLIHV